MKGISILSKTSFTANASFQGIEPIHRFVEQISKGELHLHIEDSLEPEMLFQLAERNRIPLPYRSVEQVRAAYNF